MRIGQVSLSHSEYKDLQLRTTIVPFIALGVGAGIGYLYFKPKIDLVMRILDILQTVFPFLKSGATTSTVSGFRRYPLMKRRYVHMGDAVADGKDGQFSNWVRDGGQPIREVFIPDVTGAEGYAPGIAPQSRFYKYMVANALMDDL